MLATYLFGKQNRSTEQAEDSYSFLHPVQTIFAGCTKQASKGWLRILIAKELVKMNRIPVKNSVLRNPYFCEGQCHSELRTRGAPPSAPSTFQTQDNAEEIQGCESISEFFPTMSGD